MPALCRVSIEYDYCKVIVSKSITIHHCIVMVIQNQIALEQHDINVQSRLYQNVSVCNQYTLGINPFQRPPVSDNRHSGFYLCLNMQLKI